MYCKSLILSLLAVAPAFAAAPDTGRHQAQIDQIVREISPARIEGYINKLAGFRTRHTMSDTVSDTEGIGAARRWIKSELERCGAARGGRLRVAFDSHVAPVSARISRPTEIVNVVATLPGTQAASVDRMYVVSGHYDSRNTDIMDAKGDAPGANDDASGTAAVMEMACVMAQYKFDATLVFMTVAAEEQGLLGAAHWAEQARQKNLNIAGMFTNDIIGSSRDEHGKVDDTQVRLFAEGLPVQKENSDAVRTLIQTGGENDSLSRQLARAVKEAGERYVPKFKVNIIQRRDRYLRGGDHMPFLERGYAALRFTEPAEDFNHQHQNIRTENGVPIGDLPQYDDFNYIAQVARVNAAALSSLSLAPAAPAGVQVRTAKLQNDTELVWQANAEPDLAGYRIVWRDTTAAEWQGSRFVGKATEYTVPLSKDNYYFGVQAIDYDGNASPASYPVPLR
ncbi:M20/M25/M40 family metallo-hydrolase [Duganella sp. BJB488]|uniref:M20/M25/M40 family metallo-hydrolase n=1 Tax=unclassified Duganella TaxID=2636909 RepID=UPI000E351437|nr:MULTISPECIES: M28 family metallopeptidase [unclassified Duganella]NVD73116.1 M20/M25/M40 family metallo-hydrolase [Duganella sp. BJB1802]RFP12467.1 M20/M25/M40 family metallo-hydrolase [Duganella sp. BJB489]RFP16443.1 M20/M25/M40 family metallo-hydrolase [Duganella sp. BJB488]RFP30831.1 M20/M25/M40 family metallo-hydrolase [Duganella sp. BJB480]